jgi:hypothetical protein
MTPRQRKLETKERHERIALFDRLVAECEVREQEGRIRRLTVARWSMPALPDAAELAGRPAVGERLCGREEEARSRLSELRPELERTVSAHRAIRDGAKRSPAHGSRERTR